MRRYGAHIVMLGAGLTVLLGAGVGVVAAAPAGSGEVFSACKTAKGFLVKVTVSPTTPAVCPAGMTAVTWNEEGLKGATGATGQDGEDGNTLLNGTGKPASSLGQNGDFYMDTTQWRIYGPKANGAWGAPEDLIPEDGLLPDFGCEFPDFLYGFDNGEPLCDAPFLNLP